MNKKDDWADPFHLKGKKIIVTGASSGIGRTTAILLSRQGADIIALARREEALKQTLVMMESGNHSYKTADLSDFDSTVNIIKEIVYKDNKKIDGIAHCAGENKLSPLRNMSYSTLDQMLKINFYSFAAILKCAASKRLFNENASIVGISSNVAAEGEKGNSAYGAAKAAMNGMTKTAFQELQGNGIRVNTLCPGGVDTQMIAHLHLHQNDMFQSEEIAELIVFYLSPLSSAINGQCIVLKPHRKNVYIE